MQFSWTGALTLTVLGAMLLLLFVELQISINPFGPSLLVCSVFFSLLLECAANLTLLIWAIARPNGSSRPDSKADDNV